MKGRRRIVGITVGFVIPTVWAKPIVKHIVLPAHAQTSDDTGSPETAPLSCLAPSSPSSLSAGTGDAAINTYYRVTVSDTDCSVVNLGNTEPAPPQQCDFRVLLRRTGGNAIGEILFWNGSDFEINGPTISTTVGSSTSGTSFTDSDCSDLRASIDVNILVDGSVSATNPSFEEI